MLKNPADKQATPGQHDGMVPEGNAVMKKRSKVPGVMITQYVEVIPADSSTPDFIRKPSSLTIQEGRLAFFKAVVKGTPDPTVTWERIKGDLNDQEKYITRYDAKAKEHYLEMPNVTSQQSDSYKCFATNEYGHAVCTATLKVTGGGIRNKDSDSKNGADDFRKMLKKTVVRTKPLPPKKEGEIDPRFWEVLLSSPKKDYEKICFSFGVTDYRWMLKQLNSMKKERENEQAKVVENVDDMKPIEVKPYGKAEFELDMKLKDPGSNVFLYKDGFMIDYGADDKSKHTLEKNGNKYKFIIKDLNPDDAGLYQVDVENVNIFSTDFKIVPVEFAGKIQAVKAKEREDAIFECTLSTPYPEIVWVGNNVNLEKSDKYDITVSEDKLVHGLRVLDCALTDSGVYMAMAGIVSCSADLLVEAGDDRDGGKRTAQENTTAGRGGADLERIAQEQQARLQKEKDELEAARRAQAAAAGGDGDGGGGGDGGKDGSGDGDGGDRKDGSGDGDGGDRKDGSGDGDGGSDGQDKDKKRVRAGPLVPDTVTDPGVQFISGLSDTAASLGQTAELSCKLSSEGCEGIWYKDGKPLASGDGVKVIKDGALHKLIIERCSLDDAAVYRFEADGRKSEATLCVQDPPALDLDALAKFSEPVIVRAGETAEWTLSFSGGQPMKTQWFKDDDELQSGLNVRMDTSSTKSQLRLTKCKRSDSGVVKIKIQNQFASVEATSKLIVLDKPTPPQGPIDILESGVTSVEFKWKPPKDTGGCPLTNYLLERQQVGRNKWSDLGMIPGDRPCYKDKDVDPGRRYCYRIRAKNSEGVSDALETDDVQAGVLSYPGVPSAPKVTSVFRDCISLAWSPPVNTGGTNILGYNVEKRKKGSSSWSPVNIGEPIKGTTYSVKDVIAGAAYEFRVSAINLSGAGEPSPPSETVFARDPQKPPGKIIDLKLTSSNYTTFSLAWTKPKEVKGEEDEAKGYFVEIRPIESPDWNRCNTNMITHTSFNVIGLKAMAMYWVRVIATNDGGEGEPHGFDDYIVAMPPPVRPRFTDSQRKSFMVVRAGNTARIHIKFEASPLPDIIWLKDGVPVAKHVTVSNSDRGSQLLIPTSQRSDTGIYTIIVKNLVGQETFNVEIRVTDDPKPPGPVELDQNVPGTVTVSWAPSPDEKRDDRLHYTVSKRDSVKRTWRPVADHLFNNNFTVVNILPGREYHFRVFANNDVGRSEPSESPTWGTTKRREKFILDLQELEALDFRAPPSFLVPLRQRAPPQGYECYITCAVRGNPAPRVTWYRNNVSLNTNTNYYITNVCGVCSMLVLRVGPSDTGEYTVVAENPLGRVECSTQLTVRERKVETSD